MEAMKKSYHSACKEEKLAASRETNSKLESNNPEAQKKLQEKVEKCQQEVQKVGLLYASICIWMIICPIPEALFDFWRYSLKGYQPSCDMLCFMTSSLLLFSSRQKNDTRNPWKSWTSWPLSIWRTWSRCSSSGSSLKTNASVFSKSSCWRWNITWISQPITG